LIGGAEMKTSEFIINSLNNISRTTNRVLKDLNQRELEWRPTPECNPMGFIIFHMARFEDNFLLNMVLGKKQVWESNKWYEKFNMPVDENAAGYTEEKIAAFKAPAINDLTSYSETVRSEIISALKKTNEKDLDHIIKTPHGDTPLGSLLGFALVHQAEHAGEISYIRGMMKGMNK